MDAEDAPLTLSWDGVMLREERPAQNCLVSSSVRKSECVAFRKDFFASIAPHQAALAQAHRYYHRPDPALGPLMIREDARTQSITEIELHPDHAMMHFFRVDEARRSSEFVSTTELAVARNG